MSLDQKSEIAENIYFKVIDHLGITDECIKTNGDSTENTDKGRELYYLIEESIKTKEPEKPKTTDEKTKKLKEYIWHNHCETTEEVTVYAESFEKAQELYLEGEGETYTLESTSKWDECVKNSDDFEDDEEKDNE